MATNPAARGPHDATAATRGAKPTIKLRELVELLAHDVRHEYIRGRRTWDANIGVVGRLYTPGPRLDQPEYNADDELVRESFWLRATKFLLGHEFDPLACVSAMFTDAFGGAFDPWPERLISKRNLDGFAAATLAAANTIPAEFAFQQSVCRRYTALIKEDEHLTGQELFARVLLDETINMSALFRYCLARNVKLEEAAGQFFRPALLQYVLHADTYDRVWKQWIPKSLHVVGLRARLYLKGLLHDGKAAGTENRD